MAVTLIDSTLRQPTIARLKASETMLNETLATIKIDVYVNYQGFVKKVNSYIVPCNSEDLERGFL